MATGYAAQAGLYALGSVTPEVEVAQGGLYALTSITPVTRVSQLGLYALCASVPCGTRWAQIWTITRTDDVVYRFTSLDRDLEWGGQTYSACRSLLPSASEAVAQVDSGGTMDLSGAVGEGGIPELALYAGLLDGARVEAWLVPWDGQGSMRRLLAGTFGPVDHSDNSFKVELLGDGERLQQTPLVRVLQPACRWLFGDSGCKKDLGPLTVTGAIDSVDGQRTFTDAARTEAAGYFRRGRVTITSGLNSGISAEIKEHAAGGVFTLWPRLAFPLSIGTTYSMTPGCTNLTVSANGCNGCDAWENLDNYGGFPNVPGGDKRSAAANTREL